MKGEFSFLRGNDVPEMHELIRQVLEDKGMSYQELAEKLQVTVEEVEAYDDYKSAPSDEILKKMSSILGIRYSVLRISAGYNSLGNYPDFYLSNGEGIDMYDMLSKIYYNDPSSISRIVEMFSDN